MEAGALAGRRPLQPPSRPPRVRVASGGAGHPPCGAPRAPPRRGGALLGAAIAPAKVRVDRRGRGTLTIGCPAAAPASCDAGVALATKARKPLSLAKAGFKAAPGATKTVRFKLSRKGRARVRKA